MSTTGFHRIGERARGRNARYVLRGPPPGCGAPVVAGDAELDSIAPSPFTNQSELHFMDQPAVTTRHPIAFPHRHLPSGPSAHGLAFFFNSDSAANAIRFNVRTSVVMAFHMSVRALVSLCIVVSFRSNHQSFGGGDESDGPRRDFHVTHSRSRRLRLPISTSNPPSV